MKINKVRPQEAEFFKVLTSIAVMPKMLYYIGNLPKSCPSVAIVGARKNTAYGEEIAYKAAYEAAKTGAIVVSGLAYGIDSIAHRGALDAGGVTVAVLGTPINKIYPRSHQGLAEEIIAKGGCIVSELAPDAEFYPKVSFLERNRIISGLSDVVLVVEAAEKSGSLNTATHGLEQGKEVLSVPGNINQINSKGCNRLIRQGANPYLGPDDLLELLFPGLSRRRKRDKTQMTIFAGNEIEQKILSLIMDGVCDGEKIISNLKITAPEFMRAVTMLELKDAVKAAGLNRWILK